MSIDWLKRRNATWNSARTSSGASTATHCSRSFLWRTELKKRMAAACRACRRGSSSCFGSSAPLMSLGEKMASASWSDWLTPQ